MLSPEEYAKRKAELEERRQKKQELRRKQMIMYAIILAAGLVMMGITAYFSYRSNSPQSVAGSSQTRTDRLTVLVMGVDEESATPSRTDSMVLASIDQTNGHIALLSIPRDTRVFIPQRNRYDRVNAAYGHGGAVSAMETVSHFLDIPIEYYLKTDFEGFKHIIDILGGVQIDVEKEMFYVDNAQDLHIHIMPGSQRLDGDKALQYVRYRDRLGDVALVDPVYESYGGRVTRQSKFIAALFNEVFSPSTLPKVPALVREAWKMVDTNLPWETILSLALNSRKFSPDKVDMTVVPGSAGTMNGASYWLADQERTRQIARFIAYGDPLPLKTQVLNGNGRSGMATQAAQLLEGRDFDVINRGNADHFNYPQTQIIIGDAKFEERVQEVANALDAVVLVDPNYNQRVEVTIIVGRNFQTADRSVRVD